MPEVSKEQLKVSAIRLKSEIEALPTEEYGYKKMSALIEAFPGSIKSYYESLETVEGGVVGPGGTQFGFALILADALGDASAPTTIVGDLDVNAPYFVYCGDLHVRGNVRFNGVLVVLGDLVVDGSISDSMEWSSIWVTGNVTTKACKFGATAWVGKNLSAQLVLLSRRGFCHAGGVVKTNVALRNDFDGTGFTGQVEAEYFLDYENDEEKTRSVLLDEFFDEDGMIEDEDEIFEAVMEDRAITK